MILEENIEISKAKNYINITHEKLDDLFTLVDNIEFSTPGFYPTMEEIQVMKRDIPKYYAFILWILSNPSGPETRDEELAEKELNQIIKNHTKIKKHKSEKEIRIYDHA